MPDFSEEEAQEVQKIPFHEWTTSKMTKGHIQKMCDEGVITSKEIIGWRAAVDYKTEAQSNLEQYEVQLETMDLERQQLCIVAGPVLDMLYPALAGSNFGSVEQIASFLKTAPERVKSLVKEHATISCSQALSITKSLYPRGEVAAIGKEYAAGTSEEKALQLINEVQDVAAIIAEDAVDIL